MKLHNKQTTFNLSTLYIFRKSSGFYDKFKKDSSSNTTATPWKQFLKYSSYQYISTTEFLDVWLRIVKDLASMHCNTDSMHCVSMRCDTDRKHCDTDSTHCVLTVRTAVLTIRAVILIFGVVILTVWTVTHCDTDSMQCDTDSMRCDTDRNAIPSRARKGRFFYVIIISS